MFIFTRYVS